MTQNKSGPRAVALSIAFCAILAPEVSIAADLALSGIVGRRAVLVVDNGPPRLVEIGKSSPEGIRLLSIEGNAAVVEFDGRRHTLRMGERVVRQAGDGSRGAQGISTGLTGEEARKVLARGVEITIDQDESGQFMVGGEINSNNVRFLVDTGASMVALSRATASRLGLKLDGAPEGRAHTAGGVVKAWRVILRSIKVGGLRFENVEASVSEADMPFVLLGMNVLEQMEMRRDGKQMRLKKKL
jgi:aspartyl protease family protein